MAAQGTLMLADGDIRHREEGAQRKALARLREVAGEVQGQQ